MKCAWLLTLAALAALTGGNTTIASQAGRGSDLKQAAAGFHELFMHDDCTGEYPPQPDTCLHKQLIEKPFTRSTLLGAIRNLCGPQPG